MPSPRTITAGLICACLLLGGCASNSDMESLTANTAITVTGDKPYVYTAPADGNVNVYDTNEDKSLFFGSIHKDERLTIDPRELSLKIGGMMAQGLKIPRGHTLQIAYHATSSAS
jgi:hypothetical protein